MALLDRDPFRVESYKLMRRLYTETKQADAAWCLCQALYVLKLAEPDEETFFNRVRSEDPAYAKASISDDDWLELLRHPDADPLVTSIFALIESSVFAVRGKPLRELGYAPHFAIDLEHHPYSLSPTLHYASGVMGMQAPLTFENANLDHTTDSAAEILKAGDRKTAEVIEQVHLDEIGHVGFGWEWLGKLKEPGQTMWEAYCANVTWPLRPALGRGRTFHPTGRVAAGMDPEFIRLLEESQRDDPQGEEAGD